MNGISSNGSIIPYGAIVNGKGQQLVRAEGLVEEGAAAEAGEAWIISTLTKTRATPQGGLLRIINNDPNFDLKIFRIYTYFSKITGTNLDIEQVFDVTSTGGNDVTTTALVQKNRKFVTSSVFDLQIIRGDETGTALSFTQTEANEYHLYPAVDRGFNSRNMNGTNIVGTGSSINFGYKTNDGLNATADDLIYFAVNVTQIKK